MSDELVRLIEGFRRDLEAEVPRRLHLHTGDVGAEYASGATARRRQSGGPGWTGLPFTGKFLRYLGHPDHYGYEFIAASAFEEIALYCANKHDAAHFEGGRSLCRRLAVAVVEMRQPIAFVAVQEDLGIFAVRRHLTDVLGHAESWRHDRMKNVATNDQQRQQSAADPIGSLLARQHQEDLEHRVWERLRVKYPELPEWSIEQERRLVEHRRLGCARCLTDAA